MAGSTRNRLAYPPSLLYAKQAPFCESVSGLEWVDPANCNLL